MFENEWTKEIDRLKRELEETQAELAEAKKVIVGYEVMTQLIKKLFESVEGRS